jgi:MFS family permease
MGLARIRRSRRDPGSTPLEARSYAARAVERLDTPRRRDREGASMNESARTSPPPVVWTILNLPFGALGGFIQVALTFLATKNGLSITEGALLSGAQMLTHWLKWLWAPAVDITLSPKRWYRFSTTFSALGVVAMAAIPMSPSTLGLLLLVIALVSLVNSIVGMSIESMMAAVTPRSELGRVSGWFQAGNLGGAGLGGGLGLLLMERLPAPWMAGAIIGALLMACCLALAWLPDVAAHEGRDGAIAAVKDVARDLAVMARTRAGLLSGLLCFLPVGTGAAQVVLAQAAVAARWGAGAGEVQSVQGLAAGVITALGCFAGGWLCHRFPPRTAYAGVGLALSLIACAMGAAPATVVTYVIGNFVYAFGVGLAYAAFTAVVLDAMGQGSAATKYNLFASLSNFPIWWLGLLLGRVADTSGPSTMLYTEAALGAVGVAVFAAATRLVKRREGAGEPLAGGAGAL